MTEFVARVWKIKNSLVITIPYQIAKRYNIKPHDEIVIKIEKV